MSVVGAGSHATTNAASFLGLTQPTDLPILTTTDGTKTDLLPLGQITKAPHVPGYSDMPPERQGVDFGQIDYFKIINNDTDVFLGCTLAVRLDGLVAGAGGKNPCYPDDVLCQAIDKITFQYGRDVQEIYGDELHYRILQETPEKELARLAKLQGFGLPRAERIDLAKAPAWYYLEIPFWWARDDEASFHQYAFQRLTRVVITWRTPEYILQQEDANTKPTPALGGNYILDHFLRFRVTAPSQATKDRYIQMVQEQKDAGFLYLIGQTQHLQQQINAGASQHIIQLNTFTKYCYNIRFVVRAVASLQPNYTNNRRFEAKDIISCQLTLSGREFFPTTDTHFMRYAIANRLFNGSPELAIYNIPLNDEPDMHDAAVGGFQMSAISNPQITINTVALPENCYVDFWAYCHNYVRMILKDGGSIIEPVLTL
jgi:hypothetical protein